MNGRPYSRQALGPLSVSGIESVSLAALRRVESCRRTLPSRSKPIHSSLTSICQGPITGRTESKHRATGPLAFETHSNAGRLPELARDLRSL